METQFHKYFEHNEDLFAAIKALPEVIDYIVVHELAHLREHNHSPEFWNIVAVQLPQYEDAKQWLKINGHELYEDF